MICSRRRAADVRAGHSDPAGSRRGITPPGWTSPVTPGLIIGIWKAGVLAVPCRAGQAGQALNRAAVRQDLIEEIDRLGELALVRPPGGQQPGTRHPVAAAARLLCQQRGDLLPQRGRLSQVPALRPVTRKPRCGTGGRWWHRWRSCPPGRSPCPAPPRSPAPAPPPRRLSRARVAAVTA